MALLDWSKRNKAPSSGPNLPATHQVPASSGLEHPMFTTKLPFQHTFLPRMKDWEYMEVWQAADRTWGVPILIRRDSALMDLLAESATANGPLPDIDAFLAPVIREAQESDDWKELLGAPGETAPAMKAFQSFRLDRHAGAVLAYLPVEEPWQVFRYVPIGGWNEFPEAETVMAFCKRMYERYGAVPAVVSDDTIELLPARRPSAEEAWTLALEMYAFCPDVISQGPAHSVYALADSLTKSDVWSFWWG